MKAFDLDQRLVSQYEHFSRSFSSIRADDLRMAINKEYAEGHFWPDALLSLNPRYQRGPSIDELVNSGDLDDATGKIFRIDEEPIRLHAHQGQALAKARSGSSFVVTTGTGSGKSLCFFIPIVDAIVRARKQNQPRKTKAIIIYPMNALANSQIKEIEKFVEQSGLPEDLRPTVNRYTGQESREQRERIANNPPDILLTNFMMAELLLTRQDTIDAQVVENAVGLEFIVLDELHTYRGRQGADVAVLVRRIRDRCARNNPPICIGTSATMASEEDEGAKSAAVAEVASRLFGAEIGPEAVIDESLQRATNDTLSIKDVLPQLKHVISAALPNDLPDKVLSDHPLAIWIEMELGLEDSLTLKRRKPTPVGLASEKLSATTGVDLSRCKDALQTFLTTVSLPDRDRGGSGDHAFLAFKLHRFISGPGDVFTTLREPTRSVFLEGQLEDPNQPGDRLYPTRFCRECGHEYHVVTKTYDDEGALFVPRNIDDTPVAADRDNEEVADIAGYLTPFEQNDPDYRFDGSVESFPETWTEERNGNLRLRSYRKPRAPEFVEVNGKGRQSETGEGFWFIAGKFGFCTCCLAEPSGSARERTKLAGLTAEGRSSATTLLVSSALEWLNQPLSGVPEDKRKLLGFSDNRQDAALQAGHFNDFIFVSLLRGAMLRAILDAGEHGLSDEEFGLRVVRALGFTAENPNTRSLWLKEPDAGAVIRSDGERALAKVFAYRVWNDLKRGWRFTNPSLSVLKLIEVQFIGLNDIAADQDRFSVILPEFGAQDRAKREEVLKFVLDAMVEGLAVNTESLELTILDTVAQKSRDILRAPWSIDFRETTRGRSTLFVNAPRARGIGMREEQAILRAGQNSRIARQINRESLLGTKLRRDDYIAFMSGVMELLGQEGLVTMVEADGDFIGWRLSPSAVRLVPGEAATSGDPRGNRYFHDLYMGMADQLTEGACSFFGQESREHTAQVTPQQREWREWRFRFDVDDKKHLLESAPEIKASGESNEFLPALFCSPTMELGVDISALNTVYLRNVPPTPANYAQRAGRAGRSGQAASIFTYCAAQSPHDQYFFDRRVEMISGIVRPPALDISNEDLVRSHMHAIWLASAKVVLSPNIPEILDLKADGYPLGAEIIKAVAASGLVGMASAAMRRVLEQILASLGEKQPAWMEDADDFCVDVATRAPVEFDKAFNRWRELYNSARSQLIEANRKSQMTGLSAADRRKIKAAQAQANDQIFILEQGKATNGSDFFSYRYLATEGFLPGYNFPRLPLYAFIPGEGKSGAFIQRARFLAISEFGPRSLIYHEGRAFRVMRAKLPPETRTEDGNELATAEILICPNCGAAHDTERDRCHACNAYMAGELPVKRTLRIDNVEALPAERITANDEERVRQGFDIQTVFSWPTIHGRADFIEADFKTDKGSLLTLQYANSADISRINKGLKRRREATVLGFMIDPQTGYWAKSDDEDPEVDVPPDVSRPVRIVPIVRDRKNALLLRFKNPDRFQQSTLATVQHALIRGIEVVFQLEEGEVLGEPLPLRDNRRAILIYEATEGGAGVLHQLVESDEGLNEVARRALDLMHFDGVEEAVAAGDPKLLQSREDEMCVRGCYKCLLSYYNQPDHELIDRVDEEPLQLLIDLARGSVFPFVKPQRNDDDHSWETRFSESDLPPPDGDGVEFAGMSFAFAWKSHLVAATIGDITSEAEERAAAKGWALVALPADPTASVPADLISLLKG